MALDSLNEIIQDADNWINVIIKDTDGAIVDGLANTDVQVAYVKSDGTVVDYADPGAADWVEKVDSGTSAHICYRLEIQAAVCSEEGSLVVHIVPDDSANQEAVLEKLVKDESAIDILNSDLLTTTDIEDAVWDAVLVDHTDAGSMGEAVDPETLEDAIWDAALADHVSAGSMGEAVDPENVEDIVWDADLADHTSAGTLGYSLQAANLLSTVWDGDDPLTFHSSFYNTFHVPTMDGSLYSKHTQITNYYASSPDLTRNITQIMINNADGTGDGVVSYQKVEWMTPTALGGVPSFTSPDNTFYYIWYYDTDGLVSKKTPSATAPV